MAQSTKGQESLMREVLASLERILEDQDVVRPRGRASEGKPLAKSKEMPEATVKQKNLVAARGKRREAQFAADSIEKADTEAASGVPKSDLAKIPAQRDIEPIAAPPSSQQFTDAPLRGARKLEPPLLSREAAVTVNSAFAALHAVLVPNAKTLEDLVTEMLSPMLKKWLDNDLPILVEPMVRAEIERALSS